jgi:thiamine biosynthesis lipoprotein
MRPPGQLTEARQTRLLMGMPVTVEIVDAAVEPDIFERVFAYFTWVDETFSTYKATSEISRLNRGEITLDECGEEVRSVLALGEETRRETGGYFSMWRDGVLDPAGIVKGWAVRNAAAIVREAGYANYYVDAGGDVQIAGTKHGEPWRVGIRNPFNRDEQVKVLALTDCGIATSGTAIRGQHIYNPHRPGAPLTDIVSLTVIGPDVYEADRFATAAFAMGKLGAAFIAGLEGFEGYQIDASGRATYTKGFERYVAHQ